MNTKNRSVNILPNPKYIPLHKRVGFNPNISQLYDFNPKKTPQKKRGNFKQKNTSQSKNKVFNSNSRKYITLNKNIIDKEVFDVVDLSNTDELYKLSKYIFKNMIKGSIYKKNIFDEEYNNYKSGIDLRFFKKIFEKGKVYDVSLTKYINVSNDNIQKIIKKNYEYFIKLSICVIKNILEQILITDGLKEQKMLINKRTNRLKIKDYQKLIEKSLRPFTLFIFDPKYKEDLESIFKIYKENYTINGKNKKIIDNPYKISDELTSMEGLYTSFHRYSYYFTNFLKFYIKNRKEYNKYYEEFIEEVEEELIYFNMDSWEELQKFITIFDNYTNEIKKTKLNLLYTSVNDFNFEKYLYKFRKVILTRISMLYQEEKTKLNINDLEIEEQKYYKDYNYNIENINPFKKELEKDLNEKIMNGYKTIFENFNNNKNKLLEVDIKIDTFINLKNSIKKFLNLNIIERNELLVIIYNIKDNEKDYISHNKLSYDFKLYLLIKLLSFGSNSKTKLIEKLKKSIFYNSVKNKLRNKMIELSQNENYIKLILYLIKYNYINLGYIFDNNTNKCDDKTEIHTITSLIDNTESIRQGVIGLTYLGTKYNSSICLKYYRAMWVGNYYNIFLNNYLLFNYSYVPKLFSIESILPKNNYYPPIMQSKQKLSHLNKLNVIGQLNINNLYLKTKENIKKIYFYKTNNLIGDRIYSLNDILPVSEYLSRHVMYGLTKLHTYTSKEYFICIKNQGMYYYNIKCNQKEYKNSVNAFSNFSPEDIYNMFIIIKKLINTSNTSNTSNTLNTSNTSNIINTIPLKLIENIIERDFYSFLDKNVEIDVIPNLFKVIFEINKTFNINEKTKFHKTTLIRFIYFNGIYEEQYHCIGYPNRYTETYNELRNTQLSSNNSMKTELFKLKLTQISLFNLYNRKKIIKKELLFKTLISHYNELNINKISELLFQKYKTNTDPIKFEFYKNEINKCMLNKKDYSEYRNIFEQMINRNAPNTKNTRNAKNTTNIQNTLNAKNTKNIQNPLKTMKIQNTYNPLKTMNLQNPLKTMKIQNTYNPPIHIGGSSDYKINIKFNKFNINTKFNELNNKFHKYYYNNILINNFLYFHKNNNVKDFIYLNNIKEINKFSIYFNDYIYLDSHKNKYNFYSFKNVKKTKYNIIDFIKYKHSFILNIIKKYNIKYKSILEINDQNIYFLNIFKKYNNLKLYNINLLQYNFNINLISDKKNFNYYKKINIINKNIYFNINFLKNKIKNKKDLIITSVMSGNIIRALLLDFSNIQLIFNIILYSILNLNKNGTIIYIIKFLKIKPVADIILIFKKFFKNIILINNILDNKIKLSGVYLILKEFKGISKIELNKLFNIFNILYKNDTTSKSFNIKNKLTRHPQIKYINNIPTLKLDLNYLSFNITKPITKESVFTYPSSLLDLPLDSPEYDFIKEFNKNHIMDKIIFNYKFYYNIKKYYGKQINPKVREKQFLFSYLYALQEKLEMVDFNKLPTFKKYLNKLDKISIEAIYQYHIPICYKFTSKIKYDLIVQDIDEFLEQRVKEFDIMNKRINKLICTKQNKCFYNTYYNYSDLFKLLKKRFKYDINFNWYNLYNILIQFKVFNKVKNIKFEIKTNTLTYNDIENCLTTFYKRRKINILNNNNNNNNNLIYFNDITNIVKNIKQLKKGGCIICKLEIPFTNKNIIKIIYILYKSFKNIYLYKEQSNMYSNNLYIICKGYVKLDMKIKKDDIFRKNLLKGFNDIINYKLFEIDREMYFINNQKYISIKIKKNIRKHYKNKLKTMCKKM